MIKEYIEKMKLKLKKDTESNNKRKIENLVVFLILLIITIIAINTIWGGKKQENNVKQDDNDLFYKQLAYNIDEETISNNIETNEYNLEQSLEDILSKIAGVGKVEILITYSETSEVVAMYNEKNNLSSTEETDTNGGTRKIEQTDTSKEIVFEDKNGSKIPITQKIVLPKIEGAIVIAEGASNINIKTNIIQAVSAATGLSTYRIQVFEMNI